MPLSTPTWPWRPGDHHYIYTLFIIQDIYTLLITQDIYTLFITQDIYTLSIIFTHYLLHRVLLCPWVPRYDHGNLGITIIFTHGRTWYFCRWTFYGCQQWKIWKWFVFIFSSIISLCLWELAGRRVGISLLNKCCLNGPVSTGFTHGRAWYIGW